MNAAKGRLERLEKETARRIPRKETKPLKIYTKNIDLSGRVTWENGKAPKDGEDGADRLILEIVQTKPD